MHPTRSAELARIRRAAAWTELRLRASAAARALPLWLAGAVALGVAGMTARKVWPERLPERAALAALAAAALLLFAGLLLAALRRLPPRAGALALDRHHRLDDRLASALSFAELPEARRTALMELAIDDACTHATRLEPRRAAPVRLPRELIVPLGLAAVGVLVFQLEHRTRRVIASAPTLEAVTLSPDDLELFRDAARELADRSASGDTREAVERFNRLVQDLAERRLGREEAFRRMASLERDLVRETEQDGRALREALERTGAELAKSELGRPMGERLAERDFQRAEQEMRDLARRMREKPRSFDRAQLERLRQALERAQKQREQALAALEKKRDELRETLLRKKERRPDAGAEDEREQREERRMERELERLERESGERRRAQEQMSELDRELQKLAQDLMKDLSMSAEDLENAAEDVNRMGERQMSQKEKEQLKQRLEELRELLRQEGQGGKERLARLLKFGRKARGQRGEGGSEGREGDGRGQQGEGGNEDGEGQGEGGGQLRLGRGGKELLLPGQERGGGQGERGAGDPKGAGEQPGGGGEPGGQGIGSGPGPAIAGKATDPKMGTSDVEAAGLDTGQGATRSEVILGAAERGFRGRGYKKVFTEYHTVAEQEIEKDRIPDGYRFYVKRYFQLIRPRE